MGRKDHKSDESFTELDTSIKKFLWVRFQKDKGYGANIVLIGINRVLITKKIACKDAPGEWHKVGKMTVVNKQHGTRYVNLKINLY